ncbi:unnamed protein product [Linum tenue]|uniref:alpha-galactosidase n=1 Tax=Linum tenue TaxID=586396 RepID=A0AAV0N5F1_9ROSI|nr:unnamed protein product [Linum tenue]
MKTSLFFFFCCSLSLLFCFHLPRVSSSAGVDRLKLPPRGWNSYDSFCWTISEDDFLTSAKVVAKYLKSHGYEYVVVDYLWYRRLVPGAYVESLGFDVIDQWGRMVPAPDRWPSAKSGKGFTEVAKEVHSLGLKFGIHVMRGLSRQAFDANTPILDITTGRAYKESGREWRAQDIGIKERSCAWMPHGFMSVNTSLPAGRAFLSSLYHQYAEWGVDFIKHDCVFGADFNLEEITYVSRVLKKLNRPILYSLSPGTSVTPAMAKELKGLANMYRVTADDWDSWGDVASHFDVARDFAKAEMVPGEGLLGNSWPDLDMLPLGWLTDQGVNRGPHRQCNLTLDEQRTQVDIRISGVRSWIATGRRGEIYVAFFNLNVEKTLISAKLSDMAKVLPGRNLEHKAACKGREVWSGQRYGAVGDPLEMVVEKHGCALFVLTCS